MPQFDADRNIAEALSGMELCVPEISVSLQEDDMLKHSANASYESLNKVYHSESMHEMEVNADLQTVDLCNPYVLMFLAKETTYHHAFWPHTAKRFLAFKSILRKNKDVRKSLKDGNFLNMLNKHYDAMTICPLDGKIMYDGHRQELKNMKQVISIVEKAIADEA